MKKKSENTIGEFKGVSNWVFAFRKKILYQKLSSHGSCS